MQRTSRSDAADVPRGAPPPAAEEELSAAAIVSLPSGGAGHRSRAERSHLRAHRQSSLSRTLCIFRDLPGNLVGLTEGVRRCPLTCCEVSPMSARAAMPQATRVASRCRKYRAAFLSCDSGAKERKVFQIGPDNAGQAWRHAQALMLLSARRNARLLALSAPLSNSLLFMQPGRMNTPSHITISGLRTERNISSTILQE